VCVCVCLSKDRIECQDNRVVMKRWARHLGRARNRWGHKGGPESETKALVAQGEGPRRRKKPVLFKPDNLQSSFAVESE